MARLRTFNVRAEEVSCSVFEVLAPTITARLQIEDIVELSNDTEPHGRDVIIGEPPSRGHRRQCVIRPLLVG
jgi:hypothetical protein